jgi:hypothetical protein
LCQERSKRIVPLPQVAVRPLKSTRGPPVAPRESCRHLRSDHLPVRTPAPANVAKVTKSRAELRARLLLTGTSIPCGCRQPRTDAGTSRIRTEQNVDHIRTHHQPFRLKVYCSGCPKLLGVDISSEHRKHVEGCVPRLSINLAVIQR